MANFTATNIATGAVEKVKYNAVGPTTQIYSVALPNTLAANDTITGPSIPAGTFLTGLTLDCDQLDSGSTLAFNAGIAGTPAKFMSAVTPGRTNSGRAELNVGGNVGYNPTTNTPVIVTVSAAGTTKVAGVMRIMLTVTANT